MPKVSIAFSPHILVEFLLNIEVFMLFRYMSALYFHVPAKYNAEGRNISLVQCCFKKWQRGIPTPFISQIKDFFFKETMFPLLNLNVYILQIKF